MPNTTTLRRHELFCSQAPLLVYILLLPLLRLPLRPPLRGLQTGYGHGTSLRRNATGIAQEMIYFVMTATNTATSTSTTATATTVDRPNVRGQIHGTQISDETKDISTHVLFCHTGNRSMLSHQIVMESLPTELNYFKFSCCITCVHVETCDVELRECWICTSVFNRSRYSEGADTEKQVPGCSRAAHKHKCQKSLRKCQTFGFHILFRAMGELRTIRRTKRQQTPAYLVDQKRKKHNEH